MQYIVGYSCMYAGLARVGRAHRTRSVRAAAV